MVLPGDIAWKWGTFVIAYRLYVLFSLVIFLPIIAVGARRLHDTNRSGWWQLLALIPFGVFVVWIFLAQKSIPPLAPVESSAGARV